MTYLRTSLATALTLFVSSLAFAAPLTADNIVGRYNVEASVPFQKVKIQFRVVNTKEFEITKVNNDGTLDETCNGSYVLNQNEQFEITATTLSTVFKGVFTCPSNRSKEIDFNIDFQDKTTEDLIKGTTVTVITSMAPMKIKASVIKVRSFDELDSESY